MRNYFLLAIATLFCLGMGSNYNFTEAHWASICEPKSRQQRVQESALDPHGIPPSSAMLGLQTLEGCGKAEFQEEIQKANLAFAESDWKRAEFYSNRALALKKGNPQGLELRGRVYFEQRRLTLALEDLDATRSVAKLSPEAKQVHDEIQETLGLTTEAAFRRPASEPVDSEESALSVELLEDEL